MANVLVKTYKMCLLNANCIKGDNAALKQKEVLKLTCDEALKQNSFMSKQKQPKIKYENK